MLRSSLGHPAAPVLACCCCCCRCIRIHFIHSSSHSHSCARVQVTPPNPQTPPTRIRGQLNNNFHNFPTAESQYRQHPASPSQHHPHHSENSILRETKQRADPVGITNTHHSTPASSHKKSETARNTLKQIQPPFPNTDSKNFGNVTDPWYCELPSGAGPENVWKFFFFA